MTSALSHKPNLLSRVLGPEVKTCTLAIYCRASPRCVNTEWRYIGGLFLPETLWYLRVILILFFCAMAAHLVTTTSLGIYYLMDRLYRRDRQITTKKQGSEVA